MLISNLVFSGDSGGHSPPHQPGCRCTAGSFSAEEAESPLHHGRKHRLCVDRLARLARICVCECSRAWPLCFGVHTARGNTTVCGEFNFVADPEAAYIVLDRYTCPTYIATWEFSCRNSLPWVRIAGTTGWGGGVQPRVTSRGRLGAACCCSDLFQWASENGSRIAKKMRPSAKTHPPPFLLTKRE